MRVSLLSSIDGSKLQPKLKDLLQDMIEDRRLPIPPGAKKPNTRTNPLTTLMIHTEDDSFDPTALITPVGQPLCDTKIVNDTFIHGIWASDDENEYVEDCCHTAQHATMEEEMVDEYEKYDKEEQEDVHVLTRSGRVCDPVPPQQPAQDPSPPLKEDNPNVKQLKKTKVEMNIWQLIVTSKNHREALLKALTEINVPSETSPENLINLIAGDRS